MALRSCLAWLPLTLCVAICGCGVPAADGPADTYGIDFRLPEGSNTSGAMIFFVDGVNAAIFQEMLDKGELPAIKKYFVDRGTYVPMAVANIPSVTLANVTTFVTGRFPGHHNVLGVNWFDRNSLIWRDYATVAQKDTLDTDYTAPNIYEQFPDRLTVSCFFQAHRGATKFYENWTSAGPPFFFGWYEFVDRLSLYRLNDVAKIAREYRQFPAVTWVYQLSTDFRAYRQGLYSPEYRNALRHTDFQIGRVMGDLQRAGLLDKIHIALVSDHGMGPVDRHFDMNAFLSNDLGLRLSPKRWWENDPFEDRLADMRKYDAMPYGSGDRYWAICLRRPIRTVPPPGINCAPADILCAPKSQLSRESPQDSLAAATAPAPLRAASTQSAARGFHDWLQRPTVYDLAHYPTHKTPIDKLGSGNMTGSAETTAVGKMGATAAVSQPPCADARSRDSAHALTAEVNLLTALSAQPSVDILAYSPGPNRVRIRKGDLEVEFDQLGGQGAPITYRPCRPGDTSAEIPEPRPPDIAKIPPLEPRWKLDPLGYRAAGVSEPLLLSAPATPLQWGQATANSQYPDLPAQILAYFRSPRAGDIIVFARLGWDFRSANRSGHGGVTPTDMHVPLLFAGPGIPHQRLPFARTADLMPTLLNLQNRPIPPNVDGRPLFPTTQPTATTTVSR